MNLGIYIGSFNPPHKGHIDVMNYLLNNHYVDNILIVPTFNYWNKQDLVSISHRINMLKYYENEHIKVDTSHNKYIYTVELMRELKKEYPFYNLYLIIGADNLIDFAKWKNYQELLKYPIIVMNRNNLNVKPLVDKLGKNKFIILDSYPYINISSSEIRKDLSSKYLETKVLKYIKKNNLYQ